MRMFANRENLTEGDGAIYIKNRITLV